MFYCLENYLFDYFMLISILTDSKSILLFKEGIIRNKRIKINKKINES
jgi:hypothetical protein